MATTTTVQEVLERALTLSDEERLQLLDLLAAACDPRDEDDEWDEAFIAELDEIEAAMDAGTMKTYTLEEVRAFVKQKLARVD